MRVVTYEDRPGDYVSLKLLLLSLAQHCPGVGVDVFFPSVPDDFRRWAARHVDVELHGHVRREQSGYDVKPGLLRRVLERGAAEALWIDSDVLVVRDWRPWLGAAPPGALVVAEERFGARYQGGTHRSRAWGLSPARHMPSTTNSCLVRALPVHLPLLRAWEELLEQPAYVAAQRAHWASRPIHLLGDQEALCALLESSRFADVPVRFLARGREVVHCSPYHGYPAHQMVANLLTRNRPLFAHAAGAKAWRVQEPGAHLDTSAYTLLACPYRAQLEEDTSWMLPHSRASRVTRTLCRHSPWASGLLLALAQELRDQRILKTLVRRSLGRP